MAGLALLLCAPVPVRAQQEAPAPGVTEAAEIDPTPPDPAPPKAQDAGPDELVLKNGGMLRGTLVAVEPGKSATLLLVTGETRVVEWKDVAEVIHGKYAPPPEEPRPPPEASEPEASAQVAPSVPVPQQRAPANGPQALDTAMRQRTRGVVWLHIDAGGKPVQLRRGRQVLCIAPCNAMIDGSDGSLFHFGGPGVTSSSEFLLARQSGTKSVRVDAGDRGEWIAGIVFTALGAAVVITGLAYLVVTSLSEKAAASGPGEFASGQEPSSTTPGVVAIGAGAGTMTLGIVVMTANTTDFDFSP